MNNISKIRYILITIVFTIFIIILINKLLTSVDYISSSYGTLLIATITIYVMLINNMINHDHIMLQLKQNQTFLELKLSSKNMRNSLKKLKEFIQYHFPEYKNEFKKDKPPEQFNKRPLRIYNLYLITEETWFRCLPTYIQEELEKEVDNYLENGEKEIFKRCKYYMKMWDIKFEENGPEIKSYNFDTRDHKNERYFDDIFENEMKDLKKLDKICEKIEDEKFDDIDMFLDDFFERISSHNVDKLIKKEFIDD